MPTYRYSPDTVMVETTGELAIGATGVLRATEGGDPVNLYDLNGSAIPSVLVGPKGAHQAFKADIPNGVLDFGSVILPKLSDQAQVAAIDAMAAAENAETIANDASATASQALATAQLAATPGDEFVAALLDNEASATVTALRAAVVFAGDLVYNVRDYGATGNGIADDTDAIQAALNAVAAVTVHPLSGRFQRRPTLYFPRGVYRITSGFAAIQARDLNILGEGAPHSAIYYDSTANEVIFDLGTFSPTPSNIFTGVQGLRITGLRLQVANPGAAGSRFAQAVRASGGGSVTLRDVSALGFKYGFNSPYGGDFNNYTDTLAEYCDVGYYQGPGGQQFLGTNLNVFGCVEGLVLDRFGHAHLTMPIFNSCALSAITLEGVTDTSTRQLTSFSSTGTSYQSKLVINTPWFEGNAGGLGDGFIPTNFINAANAGGDAYRDIVINDPYIVAGSATKTTTAFVSASGNGVQRLLVNRPVFSGTMTRWFTSPLSSWRINDLRVTTGYTAPALSSTNAVAVKTADTLNSYTAQPTTGSFGTGTFIPNSAPAIVSGKVLIGWMRLTTGSAHVNGTDWTPVYGTTT